jgi:hypothetical protein
VSRFSRAADQLHAKSAVLVERLDGDMRKIMLAWTAAASFACGLRIAVTSPDAPLAHNLAALVPYMLVVGAPVASLMLAFRWFKQGENFAQPRRSLAQFGCWRPVQLPIARSLPLYGSTGLMASLMLGILINVPIRSLEFLAAIPGVTAHPLWLGLLSTLMLTDVILLSSLYCVAFVAALRRVPMFPRLLLIVWAIDIMMQSLIFFVVRHSGELPADVAVALHQFLLGNVKKVLISVAIWLPYLILSKRVNLTFRHRIPA